MRAQQYLNVIPSVGRDGAARRPRRVQRRNVWRDSRLTRGSFRPLCGRDIEFCPRSSSSWRVFEGEAKPISTNLKVEIRTGINLPKSLFTAILVDADKSFPTDHFIAFLVGEADDT